MYKIRRIGRQTMCGGVISLGSTLVKGLEEKCHLELLRQEQTIAVNRT